MTGGTVQSLQANVIDDLKLENAAVLDRYISLSSLAQNVASCFHVLRACGSITCTLLQRLNFHHARRERTIMCVLFCSAPQCVDPPQYRGLYGHAFREHVTGYGPGVLHRGGHHSPRLLLCMYPLLTVSVPRVGPLLFL